MDIDSELHIFGSIEKISGDLPTKLVSIEMEFAEITQNAEKVLVSGAEA
jgi:hypothetical protein